MFSGFKKSKGPSKAWQAMQNASTLGLHLVSGTVVGLAIGLYLDSKLDTKPWLTLVFLLVGIAAGFKNVYVDVKKLQQLQDEDNAAPERPASKGEKEGDNESVRRH